MGMFGCIKWFVTFGNRASTWLSVIENRWTVRIRVIEALVRVFCCIRLCLCGAVRTRKNRNMQHANGAVILTGKCTTWLIYAELELDSAVQVLKPDVCSIVAARIRHWQPEMNDLTVDRRRFQTVMLTRPVTSRPRPEDARSGSRPRSWVSRPRARTPYIHNVRDLHGPIPYHHFHKKINVFYACCSFIVNIAFISQLFKESLI